MIVYWRIGDIEPKALAELGIILVGPRVNDGYHLLSVGLIFASMDDISC